MTPDKPECMRIARQFGKEYFDGDRKYGYGGYYYDGRFKEVAKKLSENYVIKRKTKILDYGCGKGFLMYDLQEMFGCQCTGYEISKYAKDNAYKVGDKIFDYFTGGYDLVLALGVLHNLPLQSLRWAIGDIQKAGKNKFITVDSYRNEKELYNLQCWTLTCEQFFTPDEWRFLFNEWGYTGDYEFLFFE
jgi:SAM-dependent methyltransferase